jgi:phospholipid/cholesterol/gamma-HCH transport system substrate-binding protein
MKREIGRWRALASAGFVIAVTALSGFGLLQVANRQWQVQKTFDVRADFATIGGVEVGHRVRIQGIDAGVVETIIPPGKPAEPVRLVLRVDERLRSLVRADALARIISEGLVGAKVVEIIPGGANSPPLGEPAVIASEPPVEIADILKKAAASLSRLDQVAAAAEKGLGDVNSIAATIRKGEGSLGKLVQEDEAYRKLVALSNRGERTLGDLEENLAALKHTWPLSRYFNERAFYDRDRLLFHPNSTRESLTLREEELFEHGRAMLTAPGRRRLDEVATWFKRVKRPTSEVVIAAFTNESRDPDLAQILTQEQADAVRKYLVDRHSLASAGWFSARKVAAVGFGSELPRTLSDAEHNLPARRIDVVVFTPQA